MIREEQSGLCLLFRGQAGTSGGGHELVTLRDCNKDNPRFFWHLGNINRRSGRCCSGLRAWNTEQCFQGVEGRGNAGTSICEVTGRNDMQHWALTEDGQLRRRDRCLGVGSGNKLIESPCISFRSKGGGRFTKQASRVPIETQLYKKAQLEHPEIFLKLNQDLAAQAKAAALGPPACKKNPCFKFLYTTDG